MKQKRSTNTIRQSKYFTDIMDIYIKNQGKVSDGNIFKMIREFDPGISRSAFYRWVKEQRDKANALENKALEAIPVIRALEKVDEHALYAKAIQKALDVYGDDELLKLIPPKDLINAGLGAAKLIQAEKEILLDQGNHKEEIDLKKEAMYAAYKPTTVIEVHNDGEERPDSLREGSAGDGLKRPSDPMAEGDGQ